MWVRVFACLAIAIGIWFNALVLRMLKYGWKEQQERETAQADLRQGLTRQQNQAPAHTYPQQVTPQGVYYPNDHIQF